MCGCVSTWVVLCSQYKTEKDGVVETRVEKRILITSDADDIDHDKVGQLHLFFPVLHLKLRGGCLWEAVLLIFQPTRFIVYLL